MALLLLTTKSVVPALLMVLPVPAEKLPSTAASDTPVLELELLSISEKGREAVTVDRFAAAPPVALTVEPEPTAIWNPAEPV